MSYKVIIFDADQTLFNFDQSEKIAFQKLLNQIEFEKEFDRLFPIYMKENNETWKALEQGLISQND